MDDFDPYLKWLGIREAQRPVNHYRLLGLDLFESDADVISTAADRQMAHVRTYQSGVRGELSQKILSELAIARRCLLVPEQKQDYDEQLRQAESQPQLTKTTPVISAMDLGSPNSSPSSTRSVAVTADPSLREKRQKREKNQMAMSLVGWFGGGLAAVALCAALIQFGVLPGFGKKQTSSDDRLVSNIDLEPKTKTETAPKFQPSKNRPAKNRPAKLNQKSPDSAEKTNKSANENASDPSRPDFQWRRASLHLYPAPDTVAQNLLALVGKSVADQKTHRYDASGTQGGNSEYQWLSGKHLLVGLALSPAQDGTIRTMAPLQLSVNGIHFGQEYGRIQSKQRTLLLAKPGYAVGAMEVSTEHPLKCVRLVYMKILRDRLDTNDQYTSEWFPKMIRPITRIRNSVGLPLVGMHGRYQRSSNISTMGVIGALTHDALGLVTISSTDSKGAPVKPGAVPAENAVETPNVVKASPPTKNEWAAAREELLVLYDRQFRDAEANPRLLGSQNGNVRESEMSRARSRAKALAQLLSRDAQSESSQPTTQYTMYLEAAEIGVRLGDLEMAVNAYKELDRRYEMDFWRLMKDKVKETAGNTTSNNSFTFRRDLDKLVEQAVVEQRFKEAEGMVDWALDIVRKTDRAQADRYREKGRLIGSMKKVQTANDRALKMIEEQPDNPKAHEDRGMYEFLIKDEVETALQLWTKSSDKPLLRLVEQRSATDFTSPSSLLTVAEIWRDIGAPNRTFKDKRFLEQAKSLYEDAVGMVDGLEKRRIERMLKELQAEIDE